MTSPDLNRIYLSATLAFMAFLPAALSILISFYHTQRNNEIMPRNLQSFRIAIHVLTGSLPVILVSYFAALEGIVHYTNISNYSVNALLKPQITAVILMSASVTLVTVALLWFVKRFFESIDGRYTPLEDLQL